jgi:broad specificity phosphatase PhoE
MPASRLHLVRHGEVFNPSGVLYERIEGFELSDLGHEMAEAAAKALLAQGRKIKRLIASPLIRAQQSAAPIAKQFDVAVDLDERVIEPWNKFKGIKLAPAAFLKRPSLILNLANPKLPSWGEPYDEVAARMQTAALDAWDSVDGGDVVIVSHQLPIWMLCRSSAGLELPHSPKSRRCSLSSITSFEVIKGKLTEVSYVEPGLAHAANAIDGGAV